MVFSSEIFLFLYLPILFVVYFLTTLLHSIKISNIVLLIFSLIFIAWGSGKDIIVLFAMISINYTAGFLLSLTNNENQRKAALVFAVVCSLALLFYFKYSLFFSENARYVLSRVGISWHVPSAIKNIVLPLGISFYTFQALSYSIDVYRKKCEPTRNPINFMLYVSLFPQLIAGPIVRYKDIYKQITERSFTSDRIYQGTIRFIMGFCKKVLLANNMAVAADTVFNLDILEINTPLAWIGIIAYALQIYLDFSAYSDMAIGLGRIFGFDFMENFNFPYIASSVQDFWRRWHISLSSWLKDYLYIPLGGNRKSKSRTYINLIVVFLLCGLWHGASWTFVVWGIWHGLFLIVERTKFGALINKIPSWISRIYMLLVVILGWVFFRSDSIGFALRYIKRMIWPVYSDLTLRIMPAEICQNDIIIAALFGVLSSAGLFELLRKRESEAGIAYRIGFQMVLLFFFLMAIGMLYTGGYNPFIYFRF